MQELQLIPMESKPGQNKRDRLPNVFRGEPHGGIPHGLLYSRWLILAALFDIVLSEAGYLAWYFAPCPSGNLSFLGAFCQIQTWGFIQQCLPVWIVFLVSWLLSFLLGYMFIENAKDAPGKQNKYLSRFLGSISNFEHFRWLLVFYICIVSASVIVTALLKGMQPIPIALAIVVLFVLIWTSWHNFRVKLSEEPEQDMLMLSAGQVQEAPKLSEEPGQEPAKSPEEPGPVFVPDESVYTAGYLLCCLLRIRVRGRGKRNKPGTTVAGMH